MDFPFSLFINWKTLSHFQCRFLSFVFVFGLFAWDALPALRAGGHARAGVDNVLTGTISNDICNMNWLHWWKKPYSWKCLWISIHCPNPKTRTILIPWTWKSKGTCKKLERMICAWAKNLIKFSSKSKKEECFLKITKFEIEMNPTFCLSHFEFDLLNHEE